MNVASSAICAHLLRVLVHHVNEDIFSFPHAQQEATTALLLLLAQTQLLPAHVQEQVLTAQDVQQLAKAMQMVDEASLEALRPVLLFLQQWLFRQKELYPQQLAKVSAIFAPLLCPLGQRTGRASEAVTAMSLLISNALNIFLPGLGQATATMQPHAAPAPSILPPPVASPAPLPRSPAPRSSAPKQVAPAPAPACTVATAAAAAAAEHEELEPWLQTPAFVQLTSALVATTVCACLFWDDEEEQAKQEQAQEGLNNAGHSQWAGQQVAAAEDARRLVPLPTLIPSCAVQAQVQPTAHMRVPPPTTTWLDMGEDAEVLCIVRSPAPSLKPVVPCVPPSAFALAASGAPSPRTKHGGVADVWQLSPRGTTPLMRSASAPVMGSAAALTAAMAHGLMLGTKCGGLDGGVDSCPTATACLALASPRTYGSNHANVGVGVRLSRSMSVHDAGSVHHAAVAVLTAGCMSPAKVLSSHMSSEEQPFGWGAASAAPALLPGMLVSSAVAKHAALLPLPLGGASIRVG